MTKQTKHSALVVLLLVAFNPFWEALKYSLKADPAPRKMNIQELKHRAKTQKRDGRRITADKYFTDEQLLEIQSRLRLWIEEAGGTVHAATRNRWRLYFLTLMHTGARSIEGLMLTPKDILDDGRVYIRAAKKSDDRSNRIPEDLHTELRALAKESTDFLFMTDPSVARRMFKKVLPVKARHLGLHALRHTFAMRVYRETKDILIVKNLLGHRSISSTMVYLSHEDYKAKDLS